MVLIVNEGNKAPGKLVVMDRDKAHHQQYQYDDEYIEMSMKLSCDNHHYYNQNKEIMNIEKEEEEILVCKDQEKEEEQKQINNENKEIIIHNNNEKKKDDMDPPTPGDDDVCPICFDRFIIPCRTNCGHWFCGSCILQFWMFRSSMKPCTCPLCCCRIVNLKPVTSQLIQPPDDIVEVLKKVDTYNSLYISGVVGAVNRVKAIPFFMGKMFRVLLDPDGMRCIYYAMRLFGLFLALVYERAEFEFVPSGGLGIQKAFDMSASLLVLILFFVGIGYRCVLRFRARRLGTQQPWDS